MFFPYFVQVKALSSRYKPIVLRDLTVSNRTRSSINEIGQHSSVRLWVTSAIPSWHYVCTFRTWFHFAPVRVIVVTFKIDT